MSGRSFDIAAELRRTGEVQRLASDPVASVWVSANAGTGKTHVLKMRVLRLLLAGTPPERILCLTYTKAAASEMSKRVFDDLARWVTLSDEGLRSDLAELLSRAPSDEEMGRARTLFTASIETPGGFKVQTIHAFSERLLQRFPLEAGVTPGFAILDDVMARDLRRQAIDAVLTQACARPDTPLGMALACAVGYAADDRFDEILSEAMTHRSWIEDAIRSPALPEGIAAFEALLREHFAVRAGKTSRALREDAAATLSDADATRLAAIFANGSATDQKRAALLREIAATPDAAPRCALLHGLFFNSKGEPRGSFATKKLAQAHPETEHVLSSAQGRFLPLWTELKGAELIEATLALTRLADAVLQTYQDAKARRAALDFDDLIARTKNLLLTRGSAEWVLFKLDNGLDHLLVDESQDTSQAQWDVVATLAEEFFAGSGTRDTARTIFAVGDEKQSIYSFQGAAPEMFAAMGRRFETLARDAQAHFHRVDLNVSFRTTAPVLAAVDAVFADSLRTPGVPAGAGGIRHIAKRIGQAGSVEIWRPEAHAQTDPADPWSPLEETASSAPATRLANRIAATIKNWLDSGEKLPSAGRPIRPGDVLILVRKRRPFAGPMVAALKACGVPVAGADRLALTQHIAVQDLISLGGFLTLPEDDLALAEVLKSPIFDFDDDDLLRLAHGRKATLWKALLDTAATEPRYADAAETLKRWRKAADFTPPYEFWASLLERDGVRARLIGRLGPDAADPIDEFLNVALTYDDGAPASLTGFLTALIKEDREIKRDTEHARDEVRVMTVHGAKGLEAPIVFLPDTCATGANANSGGRPLALEALRRTEKAPAPFVWPVKGTSTLRPVQDAREALQRREAEERNRLLYVAMTRPRDRLVIAGFEGKKGRPAGCWFDIACEALGVDPGAPGEDPVLYRSLAEQAEGVTPDAKKEQAAEDVVAEARPAWATAPAPREKSLSIPLAPSRLAPYDTDDEGEPRPSEPAADPLREPSAPSPRRGHGGGAGLAEDRFLRGTLTHALLEHLPALPDPARQRAAALFLDTRAPQLPPATRKSIAREALAIVEEPVFAPLFGTDSRAEVPIVAEIPNPAGRGPALKLTGQIDRLAITDEAVLIVDYKTNRSVPASAGEVAPVYLYQLAAYCLALSQIYAGRPVRAALLWTEMPRLMEIPPEILEAYGDGLWQLDPASLDAARGRS
jgi:ATP-dependent helicase/nuclease subunit A